MAFNKLWQKLLKNQNNRTEDFIVLLPPPNITGSLHIGHFFNWSIQDLLVRNAYLKGKKVNWIPGIDHAGISAQFVVERELSKQGIQRKELGREKFEEKIWEWKKTSEKLIENQAKSFSFFFNWEEKRFTMDEKYKREVLNAFVKFYNDGLIHKIKRITNWDVKFQTALSDLEVIEKNEKRKIYVIRYYGENHHVDIATTRPETIFSDAAIAIHPENEELKHLSGKKVKVPILGREISIIEDELCKKDKGTGALKVTPAHDPLDNQIGLNHNLEIIETIGKDGNLFNVPKEFEGLNRKEAAKKVIETLKENGSLIEEKEWEGIVYYGEKSGEPIETILTQQWILDVKEMAKAALENQEIEFIPEHIRNTFEHWMNNIKPWCISRQIWWGHQIPIWYKKDGSAVCAKSEEEAEKLANEKGLVRESDVLDTWFSSALWPISAQEEFKTTDVLVTGSDILFFWVARMMMFTLYLKNDIPFKKVYFNGIIRDKQNQKMSKTRGNVIDPLDTCEKYSPDALRFCLFRQAAWGKDIALREVDLENSNHFLTKIKNANKFIKNFLSKEYSPNKLLDNWMLYEINKSKAKIENAIENFAFHEAAKEFYYLFWDLFCSWYIEGVKKYPSENALKYLHAILKIGSPMIPFISEEIFQESQEEKWENSIMNYDNQFEDISKNEFEDIINAVKVLRKLKFFAELESFYCQTDSQKIDLIKHFAKIEHKENKDIKIKAGSLELFIPKDNAKLIKEGIEKEVEKLEKNIAFEEKRISRGQNTPEKVLNEWKDNLSNLVKENDIYKDWLKSI